MLDHMQRQATKLQFHQPNSTLPRLTPTDRQIPSSWPRRNPELMNVYGNHRTKPKVDEAHRFLTSLLLFNASIYYKFMITAELYHIASYDVIIAPGL